MTCLNVYLEEISYFKKNLWFQIRDNNKENSMYLI